jgi:uncharacterized protein YjbI with pentapeptide repeats
MTTPQPPSQTPDPSGRPLHVTEISPPHQAAGQPPPSGSFVPADPLYPQEPRPAYVTQPSLLPPQPNITQPSLPPVQSLTQSQPPLHQSQPPLHQSQPLHQSHPQQPVFTPAPVSSASFPPPAPPFRPSRNPIVRLFLWLFEPSMIKGMAMGIVLALVMSVAFQLEAMWFIASSVLTLLITCLFGVLIGHYIFENRRKKLQRRGVDLLRQAGGEMPGLSDDLMTLIVNRDRAALVPFWERLRRIRPAAEEIGGLTVAAIFRVMAMSTLFAVLGGAISFAVFLTSYMQVERMEKQNALIARQIEQTDELKALSIEQQQIEVALSIAERRQVTTREILTIVNSDRSAPQDGKRSLSPTTANLIAIAFAQLEPYRGVQVDTEHGKNAMATVVRSPEQEQLLRYLSAANIDFGDLDLSRAFLNHADLHGTDLAQIQLAGVKLRQTAIYDAKLGGANFAGADLTLATLSRSDFTGSNLAGAVLHKANLGDAILAEVNLANADLSGAILKKAVFRQTQLGGAVLHGANLAQCDLNGADITGADIALADLSGAILPVVPKVRAAAYWWLGVYPPGYADKLGLGPDVLKRNTDALARLGKATDAAAMRAIVDELKAAAPTAPG